MPRTRPSPMRRPAPRRVSRSAQLGEHLWRGFAPYRSWVIPVIDAVVTRGLVWLFAHPLRFRIVVGVSVSLLLGWSVWSFVAPTAQTPPAVPAGVAQSVPVLPAGATPTVAVSSDEDALILTVAAYNQASIAAGQTLRVDLLQPYLAQDGQVWQQVQTEFARRVRRGETTEAELVRWGVVTSQITSATATLTTKEVWDVTTSVGGTIVSSRRGTMTETVYTLRRGTVPGSWLITNATTTVLIA